MKKILFIFILFYSLSNGELRSQYKYKLESEISIIPAIGGGYGLIAILSDGSRQTIESLAGGNGQSITKQSNITFDFKSNVISLEFYSTKAYGIGTPIWDVTDTKIFNGCYINNNDPFNTTDIIDIKSLEFKKLDLLITLNNDLGVNGIKECESVSFKVIDCTDPFQYSLFATVGSNNYELLPYGKNAPIFSFDITDIPNLSAGQPFSLQVNYVENPTSPIDRSDIVTYSFTACSPNLVQDPPTAIAPTCSDTDDGSVLVTFDRSLASNERMLIYVEYELPDNSWDWYHSAPILTSADINIGTNNTYTWNTVLPPNNYRLRYISKYDSSGTIPRNPNSDEQSLPFSIIAPEPVTFTHSKTDVLCKGDNNGSLTFDTVSGGTTNGYQYSIDNGINWQLENIFTDLAPGTYNLSVKDSNNCISQTISSATISEPFEALSLAAITVKDPSANGLSDGEISITAYGGTGTVSYQWTKGGIDHDTTQNIIGLVAAIYKVTATDTNGCTATLEITLQEPPPLAINFTSQDIACNGDTANITAQGQGGYIAAGEDYKYLWGNSSTNQTLLNMPAGIYTVSVTDSNGVTVTDSFNLTEPEALVATINTSNILCNGGVDGGIDMSITGGTTPYTISWADDITILTADRSGLSKGEYYYTITDVNNCSINGSVIISEPTALLITLNNTQNPTTAGGSDGSIDISVTNGTPPYNYAWTDISGTVIGSTEDISNLGDGTYTLTVTDANFSLSTTNSGCSTTITIQLTEPQPLSATIAEIKPISCIGASDGELSANAIGGTEIPGVGYTYEWFKENNGSYETLHLITRSAAGLSAGKYRVIATDDSGTQVQADHILMEPMGLEISFTTQDIHCYGGNDGSIDITVSGGTFPYTYSWNDHTSNEISTQEDLVNIVAGSYTIKVTDARGCIIEQTMELFAPANELIITLDQLKDPSGSGLLDGSIHISVTGGTPPYSYEWTDDESTLISTSEDLNNVGEGIYTLTVRDNNADNTNDNNGCIIFEDFAVLAPDPILITITETVAILCNNDSNGSITAVVTGGFLKTNSDYRYEWSKETNGSFTDINQNENTIKDLSAGSYHLIVTDDNNITQTAIYSLTEPDALDIILTVNNTVSCGSGTDGAISSQVSGGSPPYSFQWNNGSSSPDITNLTVGRYTLTVTDNKGCEFSESIDLIQPDGMSVESIITSPTCFGNNDGAIEIKVSGGNPNYTYLWNTGETNTAINNLPAGNYNVSITDNEGCIAIQNFTVEDPEQLNIDLGPDKILCLGQSFQIDAAINDLGANYRWNSNNGFTSSSSEVILEDAGEYTLTVTNSNGCVATDTILISKTEEIISAEFLVTSQAFVGETIVVVDVSEPVPDSISWVFSKGTTVVSQSGDYAELKFEQEGIYTITMIAVKNSCTETLTKEIIVQPRIDFGTELNENASFIKEFKLYPNPSNGVFKAEVKLQQISPVNIKIINLNSNVISSTRIGEGKDNYIFDYDINIAVGVYLVILETPKGSQIRKIIVG